MASNYRSGTVGKPFPVRYSASRSISGLFVQCKLYDENDALRYTVNLTESSLQTGRYVGTATVLIEGDYEGFYIPYSNAGHTNESELAPRASEGIKIRLTDDELGVGPPSFTTFPFTDEDVDRIAKEVVKQIDLSQIWNVELANGNTSEEELLQKSNFNPILDIVKTDIDIKKTEEGIKRYIEKSLNTIPKAEDIAKRIEKIVKYDEILSKFADILNEVKDNKDIILRDQKSDKIKSIIDVLNVKTKDIIEANSTNVNNIIPGFKEQLASIDKFSEIIKVLESKSLDIIGANSSTSKEVVSGLKKDLEVLTDNLVKNQKLVVDQEIKRQKDADSISKSILSLTESNKDNRSLIIKQDELQAQRFTKLVNFLFEKFYSLTGGFMRSETKSKNIMKELKTIKDEMEI